MIEEKKPYKIVYNFIILLAILMKLLQSKKILRNFKHQNCYTFDLKKSPRSNKDEMKTISLYVTHHAL